MYKQREKIIVLFSLLLLLGGVIPGQAQKDNRFEVSKNLDIFNALVKEVEMFYVDSVASGYRCHVRRLGPLYRILPGAGNG